MKTSKSILVILIAILITSTSFALIIHPGEEYAAFEGLTYRIDTLIISGTFVFANQPGVPPTHAPHTLIITNGDFFLAPGGLITQEFDYVASPETSYSSNGVNGADGDDTWYDGWTGGAGAGWGAGGNGGNGYSPMAPPDSQPNGGNGGFGGAGGDIGGKGGMGGSGGMGSSGDSSMGGMVGFGGNGGWGGWGGYGAGDYTIFIINESCGGKIDLSQGSVRLGGPRGGNGGSGANAGDGGDEHGTMGPGMDGGAGGNGGPAGPGGNGSALTLFSSNGFIYLSNFYDWQKGGAGGAGGPGGNGGNGGMGMGGMPGGDGGNGGNGGAGGDGGAGGYLNVTAAKIFTNGIQVGSAFFSLNSGGTPGTNDPGGAAGGSGGSPNGSPGSAGAASSVVPAAGFSGNAAFTTDFTPPNPAVIEPVVYPTNNTEAIGGDPFLLTFMTTPFLDNMTKQSCLRHTIQVVPTNNPAGPALVTIGTNIYNIAENTNQAFWTEESWAEKGGLYFRFLTYDKADNLRSNLYPLEGSIVFYVVPEPAFIFIFLLIPPFLLKIRRGGKRIRGI